MPPSQVMQQYLDAKSQAPDALLLFRMGDFYETFYGDAETAAKLLGIALTARDKSTDPIPMAGFPYHQLDAYLRKLLAAGQRVAVCEQMEEAGASKGIIRREIARVVTPGTLTDEALLDARANNYLAAVAWDGSAKAGLAWLDLSAEEMFVAEVETAALAEEFARIEPSELVVREDRAVPTEWFPGVRGPALTKRSANLFAFAPASARLAKHFGTTTFAGFGVPDDCAGIGAAGALVEYLAETQRSGLPSLRKLAPYRRQDVLSIDPATRRSLEITRGMRDGSRGGSLLDSIDRTTTAGGARALASWLGQPLTQVGPIRARHAAVGEWLDDPGARASLRDVLKETYDVERLAARVGTGRCSPRDLGALRDTLARLPGLKAKLSGRNANLNAEIEEGIELLPELRKRLEEALVEAPPQVSRDGGMVKEGFHPELDELREAARGGKEWMAAFQAREAERTGIPNLKVAFNKVFGFYVEIPNSGRDKVPEEYQRRQTVKNAERYVTPELKERERRVLGAEEKANLLEAEIFRALREEAAAKLPALQRIAAELARLDCLLSLAEIAAQRGYVRPAMTETDELLVEGGRHPVLESSLPVGATVPNDLRLGSSAADDSEGRFLLITGPNMAGKSTYIRQAAMLAVMAQAGGFVPASAATVGIVDRIFARVGASDELSRGQSTFMVEMTETANILNNATRRSLVILDEIGRGTSTYDGVSLAWAIAEHLHDRIGCRTLFATHYHELIELDKTLGRLRNFNVAVREWKDEIVFLHQIVPGGADRSYGIHVASLAGVPTGVLARAQQVLDQLERDPFGEQPGDKSRPKKHRRNWHQLNLFQSPDPKTAPAKN